MHLGLFASNFGTAGFHACKLLYNTYEMFQFNFNYWKDVQNCLVIQISLNIICQGNICKFFTLFISRFILYVLSKHNFCFIFCVIFVLILMIVTRIHTLHSRWTRGLVNMQSNESQLKTPFSTIHVEFSYLLFYNFLLGYAFYIFKVCKVFYASVDGFWTKIKIWLKIFQNRLDALCL